MAKRHKKDYVFTHAGRQAWEYARKYYLIFAILPDDRIAIIAFEKKERDILGILSKRGAEIKRELSQLSSSQ